VLANVSGGKPQAAAKRLLALFDAATTRGLGPYLVADAGEVRGFAYYTGTTFSVYADGPGEPIGAGGRYDELLARFGAPMAAVGLGLDLDALAWALRAANVAPSRRGERSVVVVGAADDPRVAALRAHGVAAIAIAYHDAALAHARSWGFSAVWNAATLFDVRSETATKLDVEGSADRVASGVARMLERAP
jgi:ATP phosphoribosyltransferase regulatory subunit